MVVPAKCRTLGAVTQSGTRNPPGHYLPALGRSYAQAPQSLGVLLLCFQAGLKVLYGRYHETRLAHCQVISGFLHLPTLTVPFFSRHLPQLSSVYQSRHRFDLTEWPFTLAAPT